MFENLWLYIIIYLNHFIASVKYTIIYNFIQKYYKTLNVGCVFGKKVFSLYQKGYVDICEVDINRSGIKFAI